MRSTIRSIVVPLTLATIASVAPAAQDILLDFSSLPSAQGFTYMTAGSHAGVAESSVFSVSGGMLTQNTMGQANGVAGGSILYAIPGIIAGAETSEMLVTARCLEVQGSATYPAGQGGLTFGLNNGTTQFGFSLTPTKVYVLGPTGFTAVAGTFDNTQFADWTFRFDPPSTCRIYRDGTLISTAGGSAFASNRLFFGDGTGGANARAEITAFHFLQGGAVDVEGSSWGEVKSLFR